MREKKDKEYFFEIFGAGSDGQLSIEPAVINFDIVKVNFNKKVYATLHNYSNCTFYIELVLYPTLKNNNNNNNNFGGTNTNFNNILSNEAN